jgi:hypothetical protein
MVGSESPKWQDLPASALLLIVANSFVGVGTSNLMNGDGAAAVVVPYFVGAATFVLGVTWHWTKRIVGTGLAKSINLVATDFRWWLAVLLVVFIWSAYPEFIKKYQARPLAKISREVDALTKEKDKRIWQRHLTDDQKSKLRDGLCSSPEEFAGVEIRAEREPEGLQYADEIADMFRRCHIKLPDYAPSSAMGMITNARWTAAPDPARSTLRRSPLEMRSGKWLSTHGWSFR